MDKNKKKLLNFDVLKHRILLAYYYSRPFIYLIFFAFSLIVINKYFLNTGSINHELIIKYSIAYQWLIIIGVVFFLLRPYMPEIVSRIEEIWGIKFRPQMPAQPDTDGELKTATNKAADSSNKIDIDTLKGRAALIEDNFRIRWLLEKTYRFAYGTQLSALMTLVGRGTMTVKELAPFYEKHVQLATVPHQDIYVWLQYLTSNGLVELHEDQITLTNVGRLFLEYLTAEGISDPALKQY